MTVKTVNGECLECESTYSVEYMEEMVSDEYPTFCPFCGSPIEELSEESDEDEEDEGEDF